MNKDDITFACVQESDFEDFKKLRKAVMRPHVDRQGLPWDEAAEDKYHRELFDEEGLRIVKYKNERIGYIGVKYDAMENCVAFSRFCLLPEHQNKGIGTATFLKIFAEPICCGQKLFLDVLLKNPAMHLFERLGFVRTGDNGKLASYERSPCQLDTRIMTNKFAADLKL